MADIAEKETKQGKYAPPTLADKIAHKADKLRLGLIGAIVLVVLAMIVFSLVRRQSAARRTEAENQLYQTEINLMTVPESGDAVTSFGRVAQDYSGLDAGARARINQFAIAYNTRQYPEAEAAIRGFLSEYPRSNLARRARLALGQALVMQDKNSEAESLFRELSTSGDYAVMPEAKLYLAQTLERAADAAKEDPAEYRRRLEAAAAEYNDIIVRSQLTAPGQRGFWPQSVTIPADFSLARLKDRLAGYNHPAPRMGEALITDADRQSVMSIPPPADN